MSFEGRPLSPLDIKNAERGDFDLVAPSAVVDRLRRFWIAMGLAP
jgi:hypothetical protein